jgi:hypothetical protein
VQRLFQHFPAEQVGEKAHRSGFYLPDIDTFLSMLAP